MAVGDGVGCAFLMGVGMAMAVGDGVGCAFLMGVGMAAAVGDGNSRGCSVGALSGARRLADGTRAIVEPTAILPPHAHTRAAAALAC